MRTRTWFVLGVGVLIATRSISAQGVEAHHLSAEEIVGRMMQHDTQRRTALSAYGSERTYRMDYKGPIGERHAQMQVRMQYSAPDQKQFTVVSESGSTIFCHQILRKLMEGEQEGALEANHLRSMLSPANYNLKLVGEERFDGTDAWVLDVSPRQENKFNYKGRVWVSKAAYAVIRIVGSPAKNPSWLMGSSSFDYRYARSGDFWLPERNDTVSHLRIGGEIRLAVDYGAYQIVAAGPLNGVTSAANHGANSGAEGLTVALKQ